MFQGCPDHASCFLSVGHLLGPIFYQYEVRDGKWKTAVDQSSTFETNKASGVMLQFYLGFNENYLQCIS